MKMRSCTLGEFIESLGRGEEIPQNEKETENEMEEAIIVGIEKIITGVRTCTTAMKVCFEGRKDKYHQTISKEIGRTLTEEEIRLVDIAFQYAFIDGWNSHRAKGGNNDK